jgi:hypothetical protein
MRDERGAVSFVRGVRAVSTVIPNMLWAQIGESMLVLVRTFDDDEGSALLESADGSVANGEWFINRTHDDEDGATPTALRVEFPDTCEVNHNLLDSLLAEMVLRGGTWGLDAYVPTGGW